MSGFDVTSDAYAQFMGRYSEPLAGEFADLLAPRPGQRALDVGSGTGALTAVLAQRLGRENVCAIDPSPSFVAALGERLPGVDVRLGSVAGLPWPDGGFDVTAASLVVHFMADPVAGLREMARVTTDGGSVGATVWDHAGGGRGPITLFWRAVGDLDPGAYDESGLAGARAGHLAELFGLAGIQVLADTTITVTSRYASAQEWWNPYTLGVGPAGGYVAGLDDEHREALRQHCFEILPPAPFEVSAAAWAVIGTP